MRALGHYPILIQTKSEGYVLISVQLIKCMPPMMLLIHTHEIDQKFSIAQTIGSMHWELKSIWSDFGMLELIRKSCYGVANIREGVSECIKCRVEAVRQ